LPNVKKVYDAYHAKGFDVLGISLDSDEEKLKSFLKENEMPWRQYFDGQGDKKISRKYGITRIPTTFLLDGNGKIIEKDLRGEKLEEAVEKAIGKK
jgi:peroxiredoxin